MDITCRTPPAGTINTLACLTEHGARPVPIRQGEADLVQLIFKKFLTAKFLAENSGC